MEEMVSVLVRWKELDISDEARQLLVSMSASTADRLLAGDRRSLELKGRSGTKPGSLLKYKIPICTFADWDDADVGFLQVDLVGHEGGNSRGDFCQSLSATDVATGWTEIRGPAQQGTGVGLPGPERCKGSIAIPPPRHQLGHRQRVHQQPSMALLQA